MGLAKPGKRGLVLLVPYIAAACDSPRKPGVRLDTTAEAAYLDRGKARADSIAAATRAADSVSLANARLTFKRLRPMFVFDRDELTRGGWFIHRSQTAAASYDRTLLEAFVRYDGDIHLRSQYIGESWVFHTSILARVDGGLMESEEIPTYDKRNDTSNGSGGVVEILSFTDGTDGGILRAIAETDSGSPPILVRLRGDRRQKTYTLSKRDAQAVRDAWQLAGAVRMIRRLGNENEIR